MMTAMNETPLIGEAPGRPEDRVDHARHRRAGGRCRVEHGPVEGDGVGQVREFDHFQDERLPRRSFEGVGHAEEPGDDQDVPGLDDMQEGQGGHDEGQHHHGGLGDDEQVRRDIRSAMTPA